MRYPAPRLYAAAMALCLFAGGAARADFIDWGYNWTPSSTEIFADVPAKGKVTLSNEPAGSASGDSFIVATNIKTASSAPSSDPAVFTDRPYSLTLTIFDEASKKSGAMVFSGKFNGVLSAKSAIIANTFDPSGADTVTKSIQIGSHLYTVKIGPYAPPGPPTATNAGSISALATVTVKDVPEPGTLALAGLALSVCGARAWYRRRRARFLALDLG
jgi:hypothetical protein